VRDVCKEWDLAANRNIDWRLASLPDVACDRSLIRQVWVNLISNAVKYTGRQPHPVIEIFSAPDAGRDGEVVFVVKDNGVGFDARYADKLFGVFQRLHSSTEFEGTGIGLANVHRIVARHGGRAWADGEAGVGATFYFSLPHQPA
jgi:light-regulated signal transduction histidine kinase (bacteriophytochrome)